MNNNECNVARDLMPLVIDQVASEESRMLVEAHVYGCEPCAQVYTDMQAKTPEKDDTAEDNSFSAAMRQLRRTVGWQRMKLIVLCTVIIPAMLVVGYLSYVEIFMSVTRSMPLHWYHVNLSRTEDGIVLASVGNAEGWYNYSISGGMEPLYTGIVYISLDCSLIPIKSSKFSKEPEYTGYTEMRWKDGKCLYPDVEDKSVIHPVTEIRKGTKSEYEVIYKEGDDIPPCPAALENDLRERYKDELSENSFVYFDASLVPEWN